MKKRVSIAVHRLLHRLIPISHMSEEIPEDFRAVLTRIIIYTQRKLFTNTRGYGAYAISAKCLDLDASIDLIARKIREGKPFMAGKIGTGDAETLERYFDIHDRESVVVKFFKMLVGLRGPFWWDNSIRAGICVCAGVFPTSNASIEEFCRIFMSYCPGFDAIPRWLSGETRLYRRLCPDAARIELDALVPSAAHGTHSWIQALAGKRVLVVHQYVKTIRLQYEKHVEFQSGHGPMPVFDLIQYRPVDSIGGKCDGFASWGDALKHMIDDIRKLDFDVALLGCGVYGVPLSVEIKRMGKVAIYTGGATQVLFGIKGHRWDKAGIYNEHWVRPLPEDIPANMHLIEGGTFL